MGEGIVCILVPLHTPMNVCTILFLNYMSCGDGTIRLLILVRSALAIRELMKRELYVVEGSCID